MPVMQPLKQQSFNNIYGEIKNFAIYFSEELLIVDWWMFVTMNFRSVTWCTTKNSQASTLPSPALAYHIKNLCYFSSGPNQKFITLLKAHFKIFIWLHCWWSQKFHVTKCWPFLPNFCLQNVSLRAMHLWKNQFRKIDTISPRIHSWQRQTIFRFAFLTHYMPAKCVF